MTAEEAKTKWCPMTRIVIGPDTASWQGFAWNNRLDRVDTGAENTCISHECAVWDVERLCCGLMR